MNFFSVKNLGLLLLCSGYLLCTAFQWPAENFSKSEKTARFLKNSTEVSFIFHGSEHKMKGETMKQQLLATIEKTRQYTLNVGEAMPAEKYNFKPDSAVWSYGELIHHIAYGIVWMEENYLRKTKSEWNPPKTDGKKAEVMHYLKQSLDILQRSVSSVGEVNEDFVNSFYLIIEHTAHHRGQATTYLRCCQIVPPEYPF